MIGAEVDTNAVLAEVRRAQQRRPEPKAAARPAPVAAEEPGRRPLPDLRDPRFALERDLLKLVIQHGRVVGGSLADVGANDFTHPVYRTVWELVVAAGGPEAGAADPQWGVRLRDSAPDAMVASAISALAVEPLRTSREPDAAYVAQHAYRLLELTTLRRIAEVKSRLQRTNPVEQVTDYNRMFGELVALEQHRRQLRELATGTTE